MPGSYGPHKATALVISLHPAMSWPASQMSISRWNRVADEHGFIVVYPAGPGRGPRVWLMEGRRTPSRMPDVVFISELIDKLEASYNIDPARVLCGESTVAADVTRLQYTGCADDAGGVVLFG